MISKYYRNDWKMEKSKNIFDRTASLSMKGIAIIMMLLHHSFSVARYYEGYYVSFFPFSEQQINSLSETCKICVSIFAFISGYGLFLNYQKKSDICSPSGWCIERYVKSFSGYWFVWTLVAVIGQFIDGKTASVLLTDGSYNGIVYGVIDFVGLSKLFDTPTLNGAWWYMSEAMAFIILTPIVYHFQNNLLLVFTALVFFLRTIFGGNGTGIYPGNNSIYPFLSSFILGVIFARYNVFDKWSKIGSNTKGAKIYKFLIESWLLLLGYKFFQNISKEQFWEYHYGVFTVMVILFCVEFVLFIPWTKTILSWMGSHSMNIFLTHSLLQRYAKNYILAPINFILILLMFIVMSLALSITINAFRRLIRYDLFLEWVGHNLIRNKDQIIP